MLTVWVRVALFSYPLQGKIFQFFVLLPSACIFSDNSYHIMCLNCLMVHTLEMSQLYFFCHLYVCFEEMSIEVLSSFLFMSILFPYNI